MLLPSAVACVCVHTQERPSLWHVVRRCWSVPCKPYRLDQGANADGWEEGAGRAEAEVFIHSFCAHTGHAWGDVLLQVPAEMRPLSFVVGKNV